MGDLDRVLQAEAPSTVSSFMQRMGRTGRRAGKAANTTFLCETSEGVLQALAVIELARTRWVESVDVQDRCWPVLVHQLLAMALAHAGIAPEDAWQHLSQVPDLRGIHRAEFDRLVAWMLRDRALVLTSGRLVLGPRAERRFGRRNFMELFAVFQSPQSYAVETQKGQPLGTLNQTFVDRLVEGVSTFLLGGRAWAVFRLSHDERRIVVTPAPTGRQPTWGGYLPQFLGFELCQKQLDILTSDAEYPYLHEGAAEQLAARRAAFTGLLAPRVGGIEAADGELRWWTFAGGRINATLRYALEAVTGDWKVIPDNYAVKVRGEGLHEGALREAIERISHLDFWENERLWAEVASMLPSYRLSKFQPLMPPWVEREVVAGALLDVGGAWRWLSGDTSAQLARVRTSVREPAPGDRDVAPPPSRAAPRQPIEWVDTYDALIEACEALSKEPAVGLDVETTLESRMLCLIQLASSTATYLIDPFEIADLSPVANLLADEGVMKLIHNAAFERAVLGQHDMTIRNVVDTLILSRERHPAAPEGHSLAAVCWRELGVELDKSEQTSDWRRRPLTESQRDYAALDAETLLALCDRFEA